MELFVVDRYDETKQLGKSKDRENEMLKKLQKNIESKLKKKRKQVEEDEEAEKDNEDEEEPIVEQPKKKIKKTSDTEEEEDISEDVVEKPKEDFQYTVLGGQKFEDLSAIDMVLPYWLAHPDILSNDLSTPGQVVTSLDYLSDTLRKNLKSMNIKNLFPVQEKLIPWILSVQNKPIPFRPQDVCVSAVTGSGKTLAYALPIIQNLIENRVECKVRALIMLPVYELAKQVFNVFDKLCNNLKIRCILLSKNRPFEQEQNLLIDQSGNDGSKVDIIVTTGGRLVEHLFYTKGFSLKTLKFLVIDEADNAMSQMHNDWYYHFIQHLEIENELQSNRLSYKDLMGLINEDGEYKIPQKLLFSATLSQDPEKINIFNLFQPKLFTTADNKEELMLYKAKKLQQLTNQAEDQRGNFVGKYTTPAELTEQFCITEYKLKPLTLFGLIKKNNWKRFLCFTNTVDASHRLSFVLQTLCGKDTVIEELSSLLPIKTRQKVLQKFSEGKVNGLICSDALARGIDIPNIEVVISYDLPKHLKIYIHRIGRTARAGVKGSAITIIAPDQIKVFEKLIETANKKTVVEVKANTQCEEANALHYANALKHLQKALELEEKERKKQQTRSTGISLFEKLQRQVKEAPIPIDNLPEAWKIASIDHTAAATVVEKPKKLKKKKKDKLQKSEAF
ncbi:unnamed protein product [Diamesa tonsa]